MNTNPHSNKKILIVGAGIAGLAFAIMCEKRGFAYDLVEKAAAFRPQGYSVTIPPGGIEALKTLGIYENIAPKATSVRGVLLATSEGRLVDFENHNLDVITVRRSELHSALLAQVSQPVQYNTEVRFDDMSLSKYDIVVGADGLHSRVRSICMPDTSPVPTGVAFWTCFMPESQYRTFSATHITQYWHGGNFVGIFPLNDGASIVLSSHVDPSTNLNDIRVADYFSGMSDDLDKVLQTIDQTTMYKGHLHEVKLSRWQNYPYVLIGDAAHAMMPATGMGSTAGMLDAVVLSEQLAAQHDWNKALAHYQLERSTSARYAQTASHLITEAMLATGVRGSFNQKAAQILPDSFFARVFR